MNERQIITKTMTPDYWFKFQQDPRVIEALSFERISKPGEDVEFRVTFVWEVK